MLTRRACAADARAVERLFDACGSSCFCQYWRFTGDKNEWLARCADHPNPNRADLLAELAAAGARSPSSPATGQCMVAYTDDGTAIGWLRLAARSELPKFYDQRFYRGQACLSSPAPNTLCVACFLVRPDARRAGVAAALLQAGILEARKVGASSIDAFPRRAFEPVSDEELFLGPYRTMVSFGFVEVGGEGPYPILRKDLALP